ncbi:MAG TPA: EpsI family protein [Sphingomicrobium sp.]|nr:EpsI family protein [Sphingomonas sp.]
MSGEEDRGGPMLTRRKFALGVAFAGAAGVAAARQPDIKVDYLGKNKLDKVLPEKLGRWTFVSSSGLVVPPEDQLARALYSQLLTRVYSDPDGQPIMLLVAQSASQTGILQIHRPEICYTAGGYQLSAIEPHQVKLPWKSIPAITLSATSDDRTEQLLYWTRIGEHLPTSWRQQRLAVAMDNLQRKIPDAVMVRVSMISNDKASALATMDEFINTLLESVAPPIRRVFIA